LYSSIVHRLNKTKTSVNQYASHIIYHISQHHFVTF